MGGTAAAKPAVVGAAAKYGAGLQEDVKLPDPPGTTKIDVTKHGAKPNDSTDDSAGFRKAIAAAKAGDEVVVPKGNYVFTQDRVELRTGVSIRGEGAGTTVITAKFSTVTDADDASIFYAAPPVNNLTLSGLRLTSSGGKALNFPVRLGSGGATTSVSRIAVRDLQIDKFHKMAISVRNGDNITIERNVIKDALATGGGGEGYGVMIGYPKSTNNRVAGNTVGPAMRHGILLQYSAHHNLVEGNTVRGTKYDAYDLHGEDEYSNELRNNVAADCGEGGFGVGNTGGTPEHNNAGPGNWIHDNEVSRCKYGIHVYRNSDKQYIEDNYLHDNTSIGINVHDEGARDLVFARNRVQKNANGVQLVRAPGVQFLDNVVTNNKGYALTADSATKGYVITGNDFRSNGSGVKRSSSDGRYEKNKT